MGKENRGISGILGILNTNGEAEGGQYEEVFLSPYEVEEAEENFYSIEGINELADSILGLGLQAPILLGKIGGKYKIVSGHRRNRALRQLIEQGHKQFEKVKYRSQEMTEALFEINLLMGNAVTRKLEPWEEMQQAIRFKEAFAKLKEEGEIKVEGRLRNFVAKALQISAAKLAKYEATDNKLGKGFKALMQKGILNPSIAYKISQLEKGKQEQLWELVYRVEDDRILDSIKNFLALWELQERDDLIKADNEPLMQVSEGQETQTNDLDNFIEENSKNNNSKKYEQIENQPAEEQIEGQKVIDDYKEALPEGFEKIDKDKQEEEYFTSLSTNLFTKWNLVNIERVQKYRIRKKLTVISTEKIEGIMNVITNLSSFVDEEELKVIEGLKKKLSNKYSEFLNSFEK